MKRPFSSTTRRPATAAARGSCVTITMVLPNSWFSTCSVCRISSDAARSRLPVGSSHRISPVSATMARAIATRCCCPPESCDGSRCACAARPTSSSAVATRSRRCAPDSRVSINGSSTLRATLSIGSRLYCWNTKPTSAARQRESAASLAASMRSPRKRSSPASTRSMPPSRFSSVLLPEPEGPITARNAPSAMSMSRRSKMVTVSSPRW